MEIGDAQAALYRDFGLRRCPASGNRVLYRSREMFGLDAHGAGYMQALGICDIYDLRKQAERDKRPDPAIEGVSMHFTKRDLQDEEKRTHDTFAKNIVKAYGRPGDRMLHTYAVMADNASEIGDVLSMIEDGSGPALIHCANGKDRAGVICACEMRLHGASADEVMADYLATNDANAQINARDLAKHAKTSDAEALAVLRCMFEARPEYLQRFFEHLDEKYGSFDAFVAECVRR